MNNIVLTGMPGAGKSSVGRNLKKYFLNFAFLDLDEIIENREGITVSEIFEKFGEKYFRNSEEKVLAEILQTENQIIALGGGALENEKTQKLLENSTLIYLKTSPTTLFKRISAEFHRPLLKSGFDIKILENLLNIREKNYLEADIIVETDDKTTTKITEEILKRIKNV